LSDDRTAAAQGAAAAPGVEERHRDAIALARASASDWTLGLTLANCATQFHIRGDVQRARPLYEEAITGARRIGAPRGLALIACNLAEIALDYGELDQAEALIAEGLQNARLINYRAIIASSLVTRALLLLNHSEVDAAAEQLSDAIEPTVAASDLETAPVLLSAAADVAAARGDTLRAGTLWAAADAALTRLTRRETPTAAMLRARWLPAARAQAPDARRWDEAWTAGAKLSVQQALILAAGAVASSEAAGAAATPDRERAATE
jgi:ATP/maltotriose-dependent transcriptional regulator MalT